MKREKYLQLLIVQANQFNDYMRDNHPEVDNIDEGEWFEQFLAYLDITEFES